MASEKLQILTNSRIQAFNRCRREHYLRYELGIVRKRTSAPLRVGSAFHCALYAFNKTNDLAAAAQSIKDNYSEYPDWCETQADRLIHDCEREQVSAMLDGYFSFWLSQAPVEIIAPEATFYEPLKNFDTNQRSRTFQSAGQRDAIALWRGMKVLVEYKTISTKLTPESTYWQRLQLDGQVSHYFLNSLLGGFDLDSVLYDVTVKPSKPKLRNVLDGNGLKIVCMIDGGERMYKKNGSPYLSIPKDFKDLAEIVKRPETAKEYGERIRNEIADDPSKYYHRVEIARTEPDLIEYADELWQIQKAIREAQLTGKWFRNSQNCFKWQRACQYFDGCVAGYDWKNMTDYELSELGFERLDDVHPELIDGSEKTEDN